MSKEMKNTLNTIDEIRTDILKNIREIKSTEYNCKSYKKSLLNVLNRKDSELIELKIEILENESQKRSV